MIIRTISQLPKTKTIDDPESLFEVSLKRDDKYISKAMAYGDLLAVLSSDVDKEFRQQYGLRTGLSVVSMYDQLSDIVSGDVSCTGSKNFIDASVYLSTLKYDATKLDDEEYRSTAASIGYVLDAAGAGSSFIGSQSKATGFITTDGLRYQAEDNGLLQFYFDETASSRTSTENTCPRSGNLVLYGWLADNGNVDPAAAWVAVEAYSDTILPEGGWIVVAIQPWVQGTKHSNLQYVGFNIPVSKGTKLRITAGFDLNYANSTYQQRKNSLVINTRTGAAMNITNSFIGYVLY